MEEVEIEIICNFFGRIIFEKETKGNVQFSLLKSPFSKRLLSTYQMSGFMSGVGHIKNEA